MGVLALPGSSCCHNHTHGCADVLQDTARSSFSARYNRALCPEIRVWGHTHTHTNMHTHECMMLVLGKGEKVAAKYRQGRWKADTCWGNIKGGENKTERNIKRANMGKDESLKRSRIKSKYSFKKLESILVTISYSLDMSHMREASREHKAASRGGLWVTDSCTAFRISAEFSAKCPRQTCQ